MHRTSLSGFLFAMLVAGCVVEGPSALDVGERAQAFSDNNRLSVNRLSMNRLSLNRLSLNRLSLNRLSLNRLSLNGAASDGLEQTEQGRELLSYVARCALRDADILVAEHDGVTYEFPGLLGVAPEWENAPLTDSLQNWVSACLLAHVNAYDTSVPISLRAPEKLEFDISESVAFPVYEATFFGNVFNVEQVMYACTGDMPEVANTLSADRALRACSDAANADGTSECQFVTVGRCRDICSDKSPGMGWAGCAAGGVNYAEAVSVYLLSSVPEDGNMYCEPGERCEIESVEQDGSVICTGAERCESDLSDSGVYKVDCAGSDRCETRAEDHMLIQLDCAGAERCETTIKNDSYAEIDCQGADRCDKIRCTGDSTCVLDCTGADDCGFKKCDGEVRQCAGDVLVCNGECPT